MDENERTAKIAIAYGRGYNEPEDEGNGYCDDYEDDEMQKKWIAYCNSLTEEEMKREKKRLTGNV